MMNAAIAQIKAALLAESGLLRRTSDSGELPVGDAQRPFLLAGESALWMVTAGRVDVLLAQVNLNGELTQRRQLFSIGAGQLLCGVGLTALEYSVDLVAIGSADAGLRRLSLADLVQQSPDGLKNQELSGLALLSGWFAQLAHCLREFSGTDSELSIPELTSIRQQSELATVLKECQRRSLAALEAARNQEQARERQRLQALTEAESKLVHQSLGVLAAILAEKQTGDALSLEQNRPLYGACKRVWQALGLEISNLPPLGPQYRNRDPLLVLAQLARLRVRQVTLRGTWWKDDHGPMVAIRESDGSPLALLPSGAHNYDVYDEARGTKERVTADLAKTLSTTAYCFYRKLPDRPLTVMDLLRFGLVGSRPDLVSIALLGIGTGLLSVVPPFVSGLLFDTVIPGAQRGQLLQLCIALIVSALTLALFDVTRSLTLQRMEGKMSTSLSAAIWDRLLCLPARFFRTFTAGDLAQRAFGVRQIFHAISAHTLGTILSGIYGLFNAALMFVYDTRQALLGVLLALVVVTVTSVSGVLQLRLQRPLAAMHGRISSTVLQLLTGIAKLRVTGAETRAFSTWAKEFAEMRQLALRARAPLQVMDAVYPLVALMILFQAVGHSPEPAHAGHFLGFLAAFQSFLMMTQHSAKALLQLANLVPVYDRVRPLLTAIPEVEPMKAYPGVLTGDIELSHVTFRYKPDGPAILDDVSLRIAAGEFVAITGPSGSGKSTLLRLLLGFEKPTAGAIYYDRQDYSGLDIGEVRRQLGVVLQDGKLMDGSIFENIIGSANLTTADAMEAAKMAGFDRDLEQMPMGLHTPLLQGGGTLSGGQRQRLLIARAIVHRPRILYFDEATSALDNQTQAAVTASIDGLAATRVVIAHRLSTIVNANRIIVLQAGRIVQTGTYAELMRQAGPFSELARRQLVETSSSPSPGEPSAIPTSNAQPGNSQEP